LCSKEGVPKKILLLLLFFAVLFDLSGCVSMSAQARRERAYRHYVAKQMKQRQRATARAQKAANRQSKAKMKSGVPSEPQVTTSVESGSGSWSEPMAPPVTVSASGAIANQTDSEPAQP
jgi:hypothetical protein